MVSRRRLRIRSPISFVAGEASRFTVIAISIRTNNYTDIADGRRQVLSIKRTGHLRMESNRKLVSPFVIASIVKF